MNPYVPIGIWYDYHTKSYFESNGSTYKFAAPLDTIPILIRGGVIIPEQGANLTTTASRKNKIELLVAPDVGGDAFGKLYWDDGDTLSKSFRLLNLKNLLLIIIAINFFFFF